MEVAIEVLLEEPMESREDRQQRIWWWDQERLVNARVLVAGAGALGNEAAKNLALLGVGHITIADFDTIELSNLSRTVLFREEDIGLRKAPVAALRARDLNPHIRIEGLDVDLNYDVGLGLFRRMDVVLGCLDNLMARLSVNRACFQVGVPYIDAGMQELFGQVRVLRPPDPPCFECALSEDDFEDLQRRFSCPGLTRDEMENGRAPTVQTISAVLAGFQTQEAVKLLHGAGSKAGTALYVQGLTNVVQQVKESPNDECFGHWCFDPDRIIERPDARAECTRVRDVLTWGREQLGAECVMELGRDLVVSFECPDCETSEHVMVPRGKVGDSHLPCPTCGAMRQFDLLSGDIHDDSEYASLTLAQLSLPPLHIVSVRAGREYVHFELTGDAPSVMGG